MFVVVWNATVTATLAAPMRKFTSGMYTCPSYLFDVCTTSTRGKQPNDSALDRMANAPDNIAWLAMMAAMIATTNTGQNSGSAQQITHRFIHYQFQRTNC
ncbi:hypothetical protein GUJ93_ZPchr0006g45700 [Zizania palustris]|uniref:Secreted protein n=1 Tax=Zizania palustris TaxID=103762 RepID=A0A8J5SK41_ZIZPA|nr:hypothetical protein GUJ93_ZPchr0006g45700 [Zizania palustris]